MDNGEREVNAEFAFVLTRDDYPTLRVNLVWPVRTSDDRLSPLADAREYNAELTKVRPVTDRRRADRTETGRLP